MSTIIPGAAHAVECPRTAELAVLNSLQPWRPGRADTLIVVPSESLRRHWLKIITQGKGATLGVQVLTHAQLVRRIREESGDQVQSSSLWARQLAEHATADQPVLRRMLGDVEDGMRIAALTIEDLIESGVREEHMSGLLECVRAWTDHKGRALPGGVAPRTLALLHATQAVLTVLQEQGFCWPAQAIESAAERIRKNSVGWLASSQILIVGYADATCAVGDLIDALRRHYDAAVLIPCPPSPIERTRRDSGHGFARSFTDRFEGAWGHTFSGGMVSAVRCREAQDPVSEISDVASQIGALLDAGVEATTVAVVARNLNPWLTTMRQVFSDYGIPFSGIGATSVGDEQSRSMLALSDCLVLNTHADVGRWLQALGREDDAELLLLSDCSGARTVHELSEKISALGGNFAVPYRLGHTLSGDEIVNHRHAVGTSKVLGIVECARRWCAHWKTWPELDTIANHVGRAERLFQQADIACVSVHTTSALGFILTSTPPKATVARAAFVRMLAAQLRQTSSQVVGGKGGGVQLLDAMEARGRSFAHLFVVGLNRGEFPRTVREDPILPDICRAELGRLVPDIREKGLGNQEERFLFAQLLSSAPQVTLSYSRTDLRHSQLFPSSLVVNLTLHERLPKDTERERAEMPTWRGVTRIALQDVRRFQQQEFVPAYLRNSHAVATRHRAYLGEIGPVVHSRDPRHQALYVTTIESIARCPWRSFLTRDLGVARRPNPYGPFPRLSSHLLGRVVHDVIDRAVSACRTGNAALEPARMRWPSWATIDQWADEAAQRQLAKDGVPWTGFATACLPLVREVIEELQSLEGEHTFVWGGEVSSTWECPGREPIHFRVDREDQTDGMEFLTDFKLGKPPTVHRTEESRRTRVLESVRAGSMLQGAIYALSDPRKTGRYLYLNGAGEYPQREFRFNASDEEVVHAVNTVLAEVGKARESGHMFARVSEANQDKTPATCEHCTVKEACPVVDSGARMSVMRMASESGQHHPHWTALWWRGKDKPNG